MDLEVAQTPMPFEYVNHWVRVLCNDCGASTDTRFHIVGLSCGACGAYNTQQRGVAEEEHEQILAPIAHQEQLQQLLQHAANIVDQEAGAAGVENILEAGAVGVENTVENDDENVDDDGGPTGTGSGTGTGSATGGSEDSDEGDEESCSGVEYESCSEGSEESCSGVDDNEQSA